MSVILFIIAVILFMFAVAFQSISERKWGKTYDYTHLCRNYKIFWILTGIAILLSISALALIFSENKQDYSLLSTVKKPLRTLLIFRLIKLKKNIL